MDPRSRLILALDGMRSLDELAGTARRLSPFVGLFKVGLQAFTRWGPMAVKRLRGLDADVFLDLKLHDIPNTVRGAVSEATELGVRFLSVHACGGGAMLRAAREAAGDGLELLAITVLTSLDNETLKSDLKIDQPAIERVLHLTGLSRKAGIGGVVASPLELAALRASFGQDLTVVTPGIRPAWMGCADQRRVASPSQALREGADFLVIGRAITAPPHDLSPEDAARRILDELSTAAGEIGPRE